MDDTLPVRRIELRPPRRVTTQFAPERPAVRWPWLIAVGLLIAGASQPINAGQEAQRQAHAREVLRALPNQ